MGAENVEYRVDGTVDRDFKNAYEAFMLRTCGDDVLPNPRNAEHGIFHNYRPWEYDKVFKYADFKEEDVVLDTGAMHTYFCIFLSQFVKKIYATDNFYWADRDYMTRERLFTPAGWVEYVERKGNAKIVGEKAGVTDLPYRDGMFDKVLCVSTVEHVLEDFKAVAELARVLKQGGRLLLTTEFNSRRPKEYSEEDRSYYRIYNAASLEALLAASGLRLKGPVLLEKRGLWLLRKHVNAFTCLEK